MPTVIVKDALHIRIKRLAVDTGITIAQLVHNACEDAVERGEKGLAELRKKTKSK